MDKNTQHLLSSNQLTTDDIHSLFRHADEFVTLNRKRVKHDPVLQGRTIINLFFENSTRTRVSFELAAKRLGADVVNIQAENSSIGKGESLADTAKTLSAMHSDIIVIRHPYSGGCALFAQDADCAVINAGDGSNEHPTQALLDAYTMRDALCTRDKKLKKEQALEGKTVVICGDIRHSRVARSNIRLLNILGAQVRIVAPPTLLPSDPKNFGVEYTTSLEDGIVDTDVIMMLRVQQERMSSAFLPSLREYSARYGLSRSAIERAKKGVVVMHPGPMNRGVEIASCIADDPNYSVVLNQVEHGVAVRQAVLASWINKV